MSSFAPLNFDLLNYKYFAYLFNEINRFWCNDLYIFYKFKKGMEICPACKARTPERVYGKPYKSRYSEPNMFEILSWSGVQAKYCDK